MSGIEAGSSDAHKLSLGGIKEKLRAVGASLWGSIADVVANSERSLLDC